MRAELPVLKRCCFCMPLRYGLMTWGYLKLMSTCTGLTALLFALYYAIDRMLSGTSNYSIHVEEITIISVVTAIFIVDAILTTVFIIGGHQKNQHLMRVYYIYGIVILVVLFVVLSLLMVQIFLFGPMSLWRLRSHLIDGSGTIFQIFIQTYFLLLLRSELMKLNSNCEFRFVNNAAQAECTMKYRENIDVEKIAEETDKKENIV